MKYYVFVENSNVTLEMMNLPLTVAHIRSTTDTKYHRYTIFYLNDSLGSKLPIDLPIFAEYQKYTKEGAHQKIKEIRASVVEKLYLYDEIVYN